MCRVNAHHQLNHDACINSTYMNMCTYIGAWWFNYPGLLQITKLELACSSGWMYIVYACLLALPYLAYITVDLNPAD